MAGNQITMAQLAQFLKLPVMFLNGTPGPSLSPFGSARVVDKTGLTGEYDLTLEYQWTGQGAPPDTASVPAPTLFVALQQQLGLKLEQTKQQLDLLVIDSAEKTPTEN